ncbi:hypothetical protein J1614_004892 [Plenodomus biglobosus]|nr:hypothetical protein J1614_004892 [Plenodomus biglobosus]
MRFLVIAATLAAVATAQYGAAPEDSCAAPVTITVTQYVPFLPHQLTQPLTPHRTMKHTPTAPGVGVPTGPPYPTTAVSAVPSVPVGTGSSSSSLATPLGGTGVRPSGTVTPSASGSAPAVPEFTGAASGVRVGGLMAGVGAVVALML